MIDLDVLIRITAVVKQVVHLLVEGKYPELERLTHGVHLRAENIASGVMEYGRTLVFPPESAFDKLDIVKVRKASLPAYSVRFPLYTKEEGRSDLSLELTLVEKNKEEPIRIEINNIIVF